MPIPTPRSDEEESHFIGRCISFLKEEGARSTAQMSAICFNQWNRSRRSLERKVYLRAEVSSKQLGNAMLIEGPLLRPGVYTGLDGIPTKYTIEFLRKIQSTLAGRPICFAHEISLSSMTPSIPPGTVVGFWTGSKANGQLRVRGYVFDRQAIEYVKNHPTVGLSMEADVKTSYDADSDVEVATAGKLTGGVLIDDPACPACRVEFAREVNLQSEEKRVSQMSAEDMAEKLIAFTTDENLAKPTRESFFSWIEEQLKVTDVPEDVIPKIITVLKKAVKVPYPYPYPKAAEVFEATYGSDIAKELSAYTDFISSCLKGGKTMAVCATDWKKKQEEAPSTQLAGLLTQTKTELEELKLAKEKAVDEELSKLSSEIKGLDSTFEPTKFLEGISCKDLQKRMLGKYLETLKKHVRPIKLQLTDDAAKQMVEKEIEGMFGKGATFESVFELKGEK